MSTIRLSTPSPGGIRLLAKISIVAAVVSTTLGIGAAAQASAPTCHTTWGSLQKTADATSTVRITAVRTGRHPCFDRLVVDLDGDRTGYRVDYVDAVYADGSGQLIPVRGGAILNILVFAPAYDDSGNFTVDPAKISATNVAGYPTLRDVEWAGSFEGQTTIGLGVRARLPFRVFTLNGPGDGSRLVIDVAHRWTSTSTRDTPSTNLPGRPIASFAQPGDHLAVVGVADNDRLSIRKAPGTNQRIVAKVSSDFPHLVATGRARALTRSIWYEVTVDGVTGWASFAFLGFIGDTFDTTSSFIDSAPAAVSMSELGEFVAVEYAADQPSHRIVRSLTPSAGDLGEVTYDITGFNDDSVAGVRIHVFGTPHDSGDGYVLKSVEATVFCRRGVDAHGLCV